MGASFRNPGQIRELAGCDCLTISPELMKELSESTEPLERKLDPEKAKSAKIDKLELDEKKFRWLLNENAMAYEKTGEGIRKFAADVVKLEKFVASKLQISKDRTERGKLLLSLSLPDEALRVRQRKIGV